MGRCLLCRGEDEGGEVFVVCESKVGRCLLCGSENEVGRGVCGVGVRWGGVCGVCRVGGGKVFEECHE